MAESALFLNSKKKKKNKFPERYIRQPQKAKHFILKPLYGVQKPHTPGIAKIFLFIIYSHVETFFYTTALIVQSHSALCAHPSNYT